MIEATFEYHNRSREIANTLRYIEKRNAGFMFKTMLRCRMDGKHRVIAVFEHEEDIRSVARELSSVFGLGCLVTWNNDVMGLI